MCTRVMHCEYFGIGSVTVQVGGENSLACYAGRLQYDRTRPVPENHRHVAAAGLEIHSERMFFTAHDQNVLIHSCLDKLISNRQGIYKTRALVTHVQCSDFLHAHFPLE